VHLNKQYGIINTWFISEKKNILYITEIVIEYLEHGSYFVQNMLWEGLCSCYKSEYAMNYLLNTIMRAHVYWEADVIG
jgi:hypothetical protein